MTLGEAVKSCFRYILCIPICEAICDSCKRKNAPANLQTIQISGRKTQEEDEDLRGGAQSPLGRGSPVAMNFTLSFEPPAENALDCPSPTRSGDSYQSARLKPSPFQTPEANSRNISPLNSPPPPPNRALKIGRTQATLVAFVEPPPLVLHEVEPSNPLSYEAQKDLVLPGPSPKLQSGVLQSPGRLVKQDSPIARPSSPAQTDQDTTIEFISAYPNPPPPSRSPSPIALVFSETLGRRLSHVDDRGVSFPNASTQPLDSLPGITHSACFDKPG